MRNIFFIFLLTAFYHAGAQCEVKYEVKSESSTATQDGKIILKLTEAPNSTVSVTLYDIMDESFPVIDEKRVQSTQLKSAIVFSGLKATTYIIKVSWRNCTRTIGGLEGIKIDQK
jgi:hypothetical protein